MADKMIIPERYFCTNVDELGNFYGQKGIHVDKVSKVISQKDKTICGLFVVSAILRDELNNCEYIEFKYLKSGKVYKEVFKGDQFGEASCISTLTAAGFPIINKTLFYQVVQSVKLAISVFEDVNSKSVEADKNFIVRHGNVYIKYGYQPTSHGYDLTHFVDKSEIIRYGNQDSVDLPLFEKAGTLEGQKEDIKIIARYFRPKHILQSALAIMCMPVVLPHIGQLENPVYCIAGPSSIGKQFLSAIQSSIWGCSKIRSGGIMRGDDTDAAWTQILNRLNSLPIINPEMQDIINKFSAKYIADMLYMFTKGTFGERAKGNENALRGDNRTWRNVWCFYCEANQFQKITGGANYRYIMLDSGLVDGETFMQGEGIVIDDFRVNTETNYGYIGPYFTNKFIEYSKTHNVYNEWNKIKEECKKYLSNVKKANSIGLLLYTYNLMIDFGALPQELGKLKVEEYCKLINEDNVNRDPFNEVFGYWVSNLLKDPSMRRIDEVINEDEYRTFAKTTKEVRGRYEIKDNRLTVYIPEDKLIQQLDNIANDLKIDGFALNKKTLAKIGILQTNSEGKYTHRKRDITRVYTKERGYEKVLILSIPYENDVEPKITDLNIKDII